MTALPTSYRLVDVNPHGTWRLVMSESSKRFVFILKDVDDDLGKWIISTVLVLDNFLVLTESFLSGFDIVFTVKRNTKK